MRSPPSPNASHAIFVTTSHFSAEAKDAAQDEAVRLIDGTAFVELMALHGIGLRKQKTFTVFELGPNGSMDGDEA